MSHMAWVLEGGRLACKHPDPTGRYAWTSPPCADAVLPEPVAAVLKEPVEVIVVTIKNPTEREKRRARQLVTTANSYKAPGTSRASLAEVTT